MTNGGWIDANTCDGMRKSLVEEFSTIYVFHLRGNQRTSGETSRREGGKVFGAGSRAPIVVTLFVKNPNAAKQGHVFYHDIGDYLSREDKLDHRGFPLDPRHYGKRRLAKGGARCAWRLAETAG